MNGEGIGGCGANTGNLPGWATVAIVGNPMALIPCGRGGGGGGTI